MSIENMRVISRRKFLVWTQAGFQESTRMLVQQEGVDLPVEGSPKQYPCLVEFFADYRGCPYWYAVCTSLSFSIERVRKTLLSLGNAGADAEHTRNTLLLLETAAADRANTLRLAQIPGGSV